MSFGKLKDTYKYNVQIPIELQNILKLQQNNTNTVNDRYGGS